MSINQRNGSVSSADGTTIAYTTHGPAGSPTLLWVHGATMFRAVHAVPARVAELTGLRVIEYDRRGRGDSGDADTYAPEREIEDIQALIDAHGGRVDALIGESSGAVLALEAARAGVTADSVIAYEPPFVVDASRPPLPNDYLERLEAAHAAGDAAAAFRIFLLDAVGLPEEMAGGITFAPNWNQLSSAAHTIRYDGQFMFPVSKGTAEPLQRYSTVGVPVLIAVGGDTWPFLHAAAKAAEAVLPNARIELIPGASHQTDAALVSPVISRFVTQCS